MSDVVTAEATPTTEAGTTAKTAAPEKAAATPAVVAKPQEAEAAKAGEQKPGTKEAAKTDSKPEAAKPVEPEKPAELAFKDAEGKPIKGPVIEAFTSMASEHKWTQEIADQQLGRLTQSMRDARTAMQADWEKTLRADKEFGGDKFDEHLGMVKNAIEKLGGPEHLKFLVDSGLEREPTTARAWLKVAQAISQDKFTAGVAIPGRPGDLPDPNDTSVAAFAGKYAAPAKT